MEVSVDIQAFGLRMNCSLHVEHRLHQLNVLSHVGLLLQMYICELAEACVDAEVVALREQKHLLEVMQQEAIRRYAAHDGRGHPGNILAESSPSTGTARPGEVQKKKASVSFTGEGFKEFAGDGLPICKLDMRHLEATDVGSPAGNDSSDAASDSQPSLSEASLDRSKRAQSRQSFVIPRMTRPRARSRSKAFSVSSSPVRHFRDWGFPPLPPEADSD